MVSAWWIVIMFVGALIYGSLKYYKGYKDGHWQGDFDGRAELAKEQDQQWRKNYMERLERLKASGQIDESMYVDLKRLPDSQAKTSR